MPEKIMDANCYDAYLTQMARYSIISNYRRNIPDYRDGLKPVQRRIIYAMDKDEHALSETTKVKSAAVQGTVMKKYHPHSDSSIYDAIKPMANAFECKMPLVHPFGNFGTIMGDGAAAARYTECWLTGYGLECIIAGLHQSDAVVDWMDNYSNTCKEPEYLPAIVPNLLINGTSGIGLGLKVNIQTNNLCEVIDATVKLIDNPKSEVVLIPDHSIPCEIIDTNWKAICNTGNGSYRARGFVNKTTNSKGNPVIEITSLPIYNTGNVYKQILELVSSGKVPQIADVDDESKGTQVRIVVTLKKGTDIEFVTQALYKYTELERPFYINFEVIDGIELVRMSYKSYLEQFIEFAKQNKFRYCCSLLSEYSTQSHRLESYVKVIESGYIDEIVKMIRKRKSTDDNEIIEFLIKKVKITDLQASYIINTPIKRLSAGYLADYKRKYEDLLEKQDYLEKMVTNDDLITKAVRDDLLMIKKKYGTPRLCNVIKVSDSNNIPAGNFVLVFTENNYVRKLGANDIVNTIRGDAPKFILPVDNTESVILFDNKGRVFKLPVHKLPIVGKSDPGIDIRTVLKGLTADIVRVIPELALKNAANVKSKFYVAVLSKNNTIKKLDVNDFLSVPPSGIIYSKLNPDDAVIAVDIVSDKLDVVIYSGHKALRIAAKDIPCYRRNTVGVTVMRTAEPLNGMSIIYPDASDIVVITTSGRINRFMASGLEKSTRNKAGSSVIKLGKGDMIHSIYGVTEKNQLNITTTSEVIALPVSNIEKGSSISPGIKAISTKSDVILKALVV